MDDMRKYFFDIFEDLDIDSSKFVIYAHGVDDLPNWAKEIEITHEYMFFGESDLAKIQRLSTMLGTDIFREGKLFYWFYGEEIAHKQTDRGKIQAQTILPGSESQSVVRTASKKRTVTLPLWLDDLIFNKLGGRYLPSGRAHGFNNNLNLSKDESLVYLGTYFPRSYAESFCIFNNLFINETIKNTFGEKKTLHILDIGSGTCGDLIGLLEAINISFPAIEEVLITAIDGNNEALSIAKVLIRELREHINYEVDFRAENYTFSNFQEYENKSCVLIKPSTQDFIISSKMINELLSFGEEGAGSYYDFMLGFLPLLTHDGMCLLLDVTTKLEDGNQYHPHVLNEQINRALRDTQGFQTLIPLPCNLYADRCQHRCFTQREFYVSHSKKTLDKSKVCYRVLCWKALIDQIGEPSSRSKYAITDNGDSFCAYSDEVGQTAEDAFSLGKSTFLDPGVP